MDSHIPVGVIVVAALVTVYVIAATWRIRDADRSARPRPADRKP